MKKTLSVILGLLMCLSFCACGSDIDNANNTNAVSETPEEVTVPESKLGDSIETDILRITLTKAQFAIKLNRYSSDSEYFTPGEYDPQNDAGKAYVAPKGHTYVAIEFKADNLDRAKVNFGINNANSNDEFIVIEHGGNTYNETIKYGCVSKNGYEWKEYTSYPYLVAGEEAYFRCYIDIPIDVANLSDDVVLIFSVPDSKGDVTQFRYRATEADRIAIESQEISLDEAVSVFFEEKGQTYFEKHMLDYSVLSGHEIQNVVLGKKWNIRIKFVGSRWEGMYRFDSDGRIQETISGIGVGYFNKLTWSIQGNALILDNEDVCQVRKINDSVYLLVKNNEPFAILY